MAKAATSPFIGRHIAHNGSVGVIETLAKRLTNHALVSIVQAHGWHKAGDQLVWPIPLALIEEVNKRQTAEAA